MYELLYKAGQGVTISYLSMDVSSIIQTYIICRKEIGVIFLKIQSKIHVCIGGWHKREFKVE